MFAVLVSGVVAPVPAGAASAQAPLVLAGSNNGVEGRYIVVLRSGRVVGAAALRAKAAAAQARGGMRVTRVYGRVINGYAAEIKAIDTDVLFGSGVLRYEIQWGRKKWSGVRAAARDQRGRR